MVQVCPTSTIDRLSRLPSIQFKSALAAGALLASAAQAVTPVVVQGADFVNAISGSRFQMIGVAYVQSHVSGGTKLT